MSRARNALIKSGARVLDILELFDARTESVTVMEVARALDLPQSSTSGLLNCLVHRGYLRRDAATRVFAPTARFALLGGWVQPKRFRSGALQSMVDRLSASVDGSVVMASLNGIRLWYVQATGTSGPDILRQSISHSPLHCATGQALLTRLDAEDVRGMIHRLNAEPDAVVVKPTAFLGQLDEVRARGFATSMIEDWHMTAVLLPPGDGEPLALGVIEQGPVNGAAIERTVRHLRHAVSVNLGLSTAPPAPAERRWSSVA